MSGIGNKIRKELTLVYNLKQMIKNELDKDKGLAIKLAQVAGLANPSPLYKFLNEPEREMNDFRGLLEIVKYLFMDREKEIMHDYILTLDPNGKCARCSLEYAVNNRMYELSDVMIEKLSSSSNAESREWSKVYNLNNNVLVGSGDYFELLEHLSALRIKSTEMKVFSRMLQMHSYFEGKKFDLFFQVSERFENEVKGIKDDYIRFNYLCRFGLISVAIHLHLDKLEDARRYANMVLDNSTQDSFRSLAYLQLGNSYILTDYTDAIECLEQARIHSSKLKDNGVRLKQVLRSINFVHNYWGKESPYLDFKSIHVSDIHEIAFSNIREGSHQEALKILDSIDQSELTSYTLGFHKFYRGLIDGKKETFMDSVINFKLSGDRYYRNLPLIELKKIGVEDMYLQALKI
jgi:tetratricopeptide (TPR) repeat protein